MYKENFIEALRTELVEAVQQKLSPLALSYQYSDVPLEASIKWKPVVLILGNYSSGKSTLINELLGGEIQETGQAPTDDSFTVISRSQAPEGGSIGVTEERDGKVLLHDQRYPFQILKKHGDRFAAHFRLKLVNSPLLDDLAIIDTPGMLDSSSERDRGYDYQQVIGDLAQIADLILVLFDPHKAGTVREAHLSLRDTLPARTFEDRVVFVLNRIDECSNLNDLLRVYGTLCWNLSQMTGRKDIPQIHLTYSEQAAPERRAQANTFLSLMHNQRDTLRQRIHAAPRYRLDNLASYIETHGERLEHLIEAVRNYGRQRLWFQVKAVGISLILAISCGAIAWLVNLNGDFLQGSGEAAAWTGAGIVAVVAFVTMVVLTRLVLLPGWHRAKMKNLDSLTLKKTQARKDSWAAIAPIVKQYLADRNGRVSVRKASVDLKTVQKAYKKSSVEARAALAEMERLPRET